MSRRSLVLPIVLGMIATLLLAACGGGSDSGVKTSSPVTTALTQPSATVAATTAATTVAPEPTATTAAAASPTATPAPAGEADVVAGDWKVVPNAIGGAYFFGEVINQGTEMASSIKVVVTLRDAGNAVLASEGAFLAQPSLIPAGEKRPFKGMIGSIDLSTVATQDIQIQFETFDPSAFMADYYTISFAVTQPQWTADHITGEVQNTGEKPAQFVQISAIGYDAEGKVSTVETGITSLDQIAPGASSPFDISLFQSEVPATFEVYASGTTVK